MENEEIERIITMLNVQSKTLKEIKQQLNNIEKLLNDVPGPSSNFMN